MTFTTTAVTVAARTLRASNTTPELTPMNLRCPLCRGRMEALGSTVTADHMRTVTTYICFTCLKRTTIHEPNLRHVVNFEPKRSRYTKLPAPPMDEAPAGADNARVNQPTDGPRLFSPDGNAKTEECG